MIREEMFASAKEKTERSKQYFQLRERLKVVQQRKQSKAIYILVISFSFLGALMVGVGLFHYQYPLSIIISVSIAFGLTLSCFFSSYLYLAMEMRESTLRRKMLDYEGGYIQAEIPDDIFENSIKMSYKYLDQYYLQTREHAQRGFFVTVCISLFGAALISVGIIGMFCGYITPSYVTCASGAATEFISAIFFYLYNRTVSSMSKYHNKLVLSQNISIALRVADSLPSDDKTKAKNGIINELLKDVNVHLADKEVATSA